MRIVLVKVDGCLGRGRSTMECVQMGWVGYLEEVVSCWKLVMGEDRGREGFVDKGLQ